MQCERKKNMQTNIINYAKPSAYPKTPAYPRMSSYPKTSAYVNNIAYAKSTAPAFRNELAISRRSLIFGLSYALDIAGKNNLSHSKSTAYLSVLTARELGLAEDEILDIYYAALLHDIALSSKYNRLRHCIDSENMIQCLPMSAAVSEYVYYHHEYYDGSGVFGLSGGNIPIGAQLICLASDFDDFFGKRFDLFDRTLFLHINDWLNVNKSMFGPALIRAFENLIKRESFLLDYFNTETKYTFSSKLMVSDQTYYNYDDVIKFAHCFASIIDRSSPYTFNHSQGVANLAKKAAAYLKYSSQTQDKMYIAGLLHDIGKLHVSTDILHKNGALSPDERFEMNKHTYFTRKILEQVDGFEDIVNYAANHHEKVDGTGYPYRIGGNALCDLEKAMAICDVYQALSEPRPYRDSLPAEKVWSIIHDMAATGHLDKKLAAILKNAF